MAERLYYDVLSRDEVLLRVHGYLTKSACYRLVNFIDTLYYVSQIHATFDFLVLQV